MKKTFFAALACVLTVAVSANAATIITGIASGIPTPGVPGFTTYTLTATSDAGNIIGFNFAGTGGSGLGFSGAMNQQNPFGATTVFNDTPEAQYGAAGNNILADSHFLVKAADGLAVGATESPNALEGAFNYTNIAAAGPSLAFCQIVAPSNGTVSFLGDFTIAGTGGNLLERVQGVVGIPEPATFVMAGMGLVGLALVRRRK